MKPSELIERGWTQKALARDEKGVAVTTCDKKGVCWCPLGAIIVAVKCGKSTACSEFIRLMAEKLGGLGRHSISEWNDAEIRTKEEVIELLRQVEKQMEELFEPENLYKTE